MRAGYLTFAFAALGLLLVGALAGPESPPPRSVEVMLGLAGLDPVELERRRAIEVARRTASCMRSLGLPYDPIPEPTIPIPDGALGPIDWADRWGFGVTTSIGAPMGQQHVDANAARAQRLPPAERERYAQALHGDGTVPGCHGAATTAVYGLRERLLAPLRSHLVDLERTIDADPAMDRVRASWVACARTATVPLGSLPVALDRERLPNRLLGWFAARLGAIRTARDLANAQALERWVAVAIARCEAAFARGRAVVAAPHEIAFLDIHGEAVRRVGAAIREAEARWASPRSTPPRAGPDR